MVRIYGSQGYNSWESHWKHKWQGHLVQGSSYICQKETSADGDQNVLMESSLKGSPIMRRSKCFIKNSKLVEFMGWWYDDIRGEADQGIEDLFNQGSYWKKPRWPKGKEVCMLVFNIIMSFCMVAGNMDHYFYLEKHDQKKRISSSERMQESISHTRWNT